MRKPNFIQYVICFGMVCRWAMSNDNPYLYETARWILRHRMVVNFYNYCLECEPEYLPLCLEDMEWLDAIHNYHSQDYVRDCPELAFRINKAMNRQYVTA